MDKSTEKSALTIKKTLEALRELWENHGKEPIHYTNQMKIFKKHVVSLAMSTDMVDSGYAKRGERGFIILKWAPTEKWATNVNDTRKARSVANNLLLKAKKDKANKGIKLGDVATMIKPKGQAATLENYTEPKASEINTYFTEAQAITFLKKLGYRISKPTWTDM